MSRVRVLGVGSWGGNGWDTLVRFPAIEEVMGAVVGGGMAVW
jgi:hypothetical protein